MSFIGIEKNVLEIIITDDFLSLLELIPIAIIGFIISIVRFYAAKEEREKRKSCESKEDCEFNTFSEACRSVTWSLSFCLIVYCILSATDLPYLTRVGIACGVAFFGIDEILNIARKILDVKHGKKDEP